MIKRKMKIMFDVHGVIEQQPEIFKPFMKTLRESGHTVLVCSGPPKEKILNELNKLGYKENHHYDILISIHDYLSENGVQFTYDQNGNCWTDDEIWWKSKGQIAREYKVDMAIDDSWEYREYMSNKTLFLLMK